LVISRIWTTFKVCLAIYLGLVQDLPDTITRQVRRNRDLSLRVSISLKDSFVGKALEAIYTLPSGKRQTVDITVPPGIEHGQTIRYSGSGR
jgi:hypothetical protein